jgi:hypothetical protein
MKLDGTLLLKRREVATLINIGRVLELKHPAYRRTSDPITGSELGEPDWRL